MLLILPNRSWSLVLLKAIIHAQEQTHSRLRFSSCPNKKLLYVPKIISDANEFTEITI